MAPQPMGGLHWVPIRLLDIRMRREGLSAAPPRPTSPQHRPLLFTESGRDQASPGIQSLACTWQPKHLPTQGIAPAGLLALEILRGGKVHLLSFGRTDVSHTLATSSGSEAWSILLGLAKQEGWKLGLRDAEG